MGYKPKRNVSAYTRELDYFLYDLCEIWGFCLDAESHDDIINKKKISANELAHDVLKAEGMDPSIVNGHLKSCIFLKKGLVTNSFQKSVLQIE